ncbi:DUF1572 family protein [Flexithrix dorotheae]|uniref:DUF1572 family protein n=1 Tax=Flexithrix dorotheae TaxID=70993 RepID=UPI00037AFA4E|nr:DUF1572 family protein [Flexithrix dorotheae]
MECYLDSIKKQFAYYKNLGEQTITQIPDEKLTWQYNEESNSIGTIVKHLWGNMLSRWTDFLSADGEKTWRERDAEFENDLTSRKEILEKWEEGWACLFNAIDQLTPDNLENIIYIRNQGHTVVEALNRQLAHYASHVGQIIFLGKMTTADSWKSLSIPKGNSKQYNAEKFAKPKSKTHFTEEFLEKKKDRE